jgi:hypothetical protein
MNEYYCIKRLSARLKKSHLVANIEFLFDTFETAPLCLTRAFACKTIREDFISFATSLWNIAIRPLKALNQSCINGARGKMSPPIAEILL